MPRLHDFGLDDTRIVCYSDSVPKQLFHGRPEIEKMKAVGYCRTSGESQRDNTSIPTQKADIETFCQREGYEFVCHYVDESRSGAKIAGRDEFQRMLRDAANGQFGVVVVWDITRFARDGFDIISNARALKINFGIAVKDTSRKFDTERESNLENYLHAGMAEDERLRIMKRTTAGKIASAKNGLPWCGTRPPGRDFVWKDGNKNSKEGTWVITEYGERLQHMMRRYAEGERLRDLQEEYRIQPQEITRVMRESGVSGPYVVTFNSPEIGVVDVKVTVPGMPPLISPELEAKVRARMEARRCFNRESVDKHHLTGFVYCADCGLGLVGHTDKGYEYYRHKKGKDCSFSSIHHDKLEQSVLGYLYQFVHDEPTYKEAIKRSLPSDHGRKEVKADIAKAKSTCQALSKQIARLVDAIANGVNAKSVAGRLQALEQEKEQAESRLVELEETLAGMPSRKQVESEAAFARIQLMEALQQRDWSKQTFSQIRRFLTFLFGANPREEGYGIFVRKEDGKLMIEFKGRVELHHDLVDGRPLSKAFQALADMEIERFQREHKELWEKWQKWQSSKSIDNDCGNVWSLLL